MMQYKDFPYWQLGVDRVNLNQDQPLKKSDIVIVGGGFTGLATAFHLLRAGKTVTIFDAMKLGDGASGKNGGMVGPSLHKLGLDGLTSKYGGEKAIEILQEGMNAIKYFQKFIAEENIDCDLAMTGRLRGVMGKKAMDQVLRDSENLRVLDDFDYKIVEKDNIHSEIGSDLYYGGVVYRQDGGLHPQKLLFSLATRVSELGGQIIEQTRVGDILKTPSGFNITTEKGNITAGQVVIASNGYTKKFSNNSLSYFYRRVLPFTSAMIATEELPREQIDRMFPKKRMHGGNHRLVHYYRASPDGTRVLFGARGTDFHDRSLQNGLMLKKHLCHVFPELENVKIDYSWSGKVAYTFDHTPHLGMHEGLYYAIGYCGSGVTRSVYLASKLARRILGLGDYHTAFDDLPFETKPLYTGTPWFMPPIFKWHSILDHIGGN